MMAKEIEIIINNDGTVEFDLQGYEGKECQGEIDDLIEAIGKETESKKKKEFYKKKKININQRS